LLSPFAAQFPGGTPVLNQPNSPDFVQQTKNLLSGKLSLLKWKSNVKTKQGIDDYRLKTSMVG
jgi:hypothetical protein